MELLDHPGRWRLVTDRVMGGVSRGEMSLTDHAGSQCLRLGGRVSTANGGGFVQVACDLDGIDAVAAGTVDGLRLIAAGAPARFNVHLRTCDLEQPWQSYRWQFTVAERWCEWFVGFNEFRPYRTNRALDVRRLTRIGIVAIGRDFEPELYISSLKLIEDCHVQENQ